MEVELRQRAIPFESQRRIALSYKGEALGDHVLISSSKESRRGAQGGTELTEHHKHR
jgi:hypothetical protein